MKDFAQSNRQREFGNFIRGGGSGGRGGGFGGAGGGMFNSSYAGERSNADKDNPTNYNSTSFMNAQNSNGTMQTGKEFKQSMYDMYKKKYGNLHKNHVSRHQAEYTGGDWALTDATTQKQLNKAFKKELKNDTNLYGFGFFGVNDAYGDDYSKKKDK